MFYDLTEIAPGYYAQAKAAVGMTREAWSQKHAWGGGVDYGAGAAMDQYYGSHAAAVKALGGEKALTLEHGNPKYWLNPETTTWPKGPGEMYVPRVRQPQPARKR